MKKYKLSFENCTFLLAIAYFLLINLINISNPILERHSFRQTQTAISTYYLLHDFHFAYITPVLGEPESIPFEFPIYQGIVAAISKAFNLNLDVVGRLVSLSFFLATLVPLRGIFTRLTISDDFYKLVVAGILFSPVYSFWSGTFMIESTALFFTFSGAFFALKSFDKPNVLNFIITFLFLTLALLQKITTALFVYGLIVLYIGSIVYSGRRAGKFPKSPFILILSIVPFLIAYSWILFTDGIKEHNPIALIKLTSHALGAWNYGTIAQRLDFVFYRNIIYFQDILPNALLGFLVLFSFKYIFFGKNYRLRNFLIALLFLYLAPLFIFTNLYWIHDYYHYANVIYLICFVYLGFLLVMEGVVPRKIKYIILTASYLFSIYVFFLEYSPAKFNHLQESRTMKIAKFIKSSSSPGQPVVLFGYDWSSEVHYYSQRKGLAVPNWIDQLEVAKNLSFYIRGPNPLIVVCDSPGKDFSSVLRALAANSSFDERYGCFFFIGK